MTKYDCFKGKCKKCGEEDTLFAIHGTEDGYCKDCLEDKKN